MARVLALDLGSVRVGVALSDPLGVAVRALQPLNAARGRRSLVADVCGLIAEHQPMRVVIGLPRNMNGSEGPAAQLARRFAQDVEASCPGVDVVLYDERLTTVMAKKVLLEADLSRARQKKLVDGQAAVVLLTDYLRSRPALDRDSAARPARIGVCKMSTEDREDIVILTDDEGNEVEFLFLDAFEVSGRKYAVLVPLDGTDDEDEETEGDFVEGSEAMIFRLETDDAGDEVFAEIEDDAEWAEVTAAWEDLQDEDDTEDADDADDEDEKPNGGCGA